MKLNLTANVSGKNGEYIYSTVNGVTVDKFSLPFDYINLPSDLYTDYGTVEDFVLNKSSLGRCEIFRDDNEKTLETNADVCYLYKSGVLPVAYIYNTNTKTVSMVQWDEYYAVSELGE